MEDILNSLEFIPVVSFFKFGNEIQKCEAKYKGYGIMWETFFPWNIFKNPVDSFLVNRIVDSKEQISGATINCDLYTDEGQGYPVFNTLEDAIIYIDSITI